MPSIPNSKEWLSCPQIHHGMGDLDATFGRDLWRHLIREGPSKTSGWAPLSKTLSCWQLMSAPTGARLLFPSAAVTSLKET